MVNGHYTTGEIRHLCVEFICFQSEYTNKIFDWLFYIYI